VNSIDVDKLTYLDRQCTGSLQEPTKCNISQWMNQNNLAENGDDGSRTCSMFERYRKLITQKEGEQAKHGSRKSVFWQSST